MPPDPPSIIACVLTNIDMNGMNPGNNSGENESHQVTSTSQEEHSHEHTDLPNDLPTELPPAKTSTPGGKTLQFKRNKQAIGINIENSFCIIIFW